ncbi:MAG: hypothetical protein EXR75_11685 [Myxococcales bacterium]|nr:hypothetical protein [Myxococcales bacterium]
MTAHQDDKVSGGDDRKLMRFFDGELSHEEAREFAALVERDEVSMAKLDGLATIADLVRQRASSVADGFDVADAVMAHLDVVGNGDIALIASDSSTTLASAATAPQAPASQAAAQATPALHAIVGTSKAAAKQPANDNSRSIFGVAAMAAAVAAGLFFWGRTPPDEVQATRVLPSERMSAAAMASEVVAMAADGSASAPAGSAMAAPDDEPNEGTQIASVDFGAGQGSVFYVPSGNDTALTAIVWINDSGN